MRALAYQRRQVRAGLPINVQKLAVGMPASTRTCLKVREGPSRPSRYCVRSQQVDCDYDIICEGCTFLAGTIEFRPTRQAQHDDACAKGHQVRQAIFTTLLDRLDTTGT